MYRQGNSRLRKYSEFNAVAYIKGSYRPIVLGFLNGPVGMHYASVNQLEY